MSKSILFLFLCFFILMFNSSPVVSQHTFYRNFGPNNSQTTYTNSCYQASNGDFIFGLNDSTTIFQRTDSNGIIIWTSSFDPFPNPYSGQVLAIFETPDGGFLAALSSQYDSLYAASILKLNGNGNFEWIKKVQGTEFINLYRSIVSSSDSTFVFFGKVKEQSGNNHDLILMKINFSGVVLWNNVYRNSGDDRALSVSQINSGELIISGYNYDNFEQYLIRISQNGITQQMKTYSINSNPAFYIDKLHEINGGSLIFTGSYVTNPYTTSNISSFVIGELDSMLNVTSAKSFPYYGTNAYVYSQANGGLMVLLSARFPWPVSMQGPASMSLSSSFVPVNVKITSFFGCDVYLSDNIRLSETKYLQCLNLIDRFSSSPFLEFYGQIRKYSTLLTQCNSVSNISVNDSVLTWPSFNSFNPQIDALLLTTLQGIDYGASPFASTGSSCIPTGIEDQISGELITVSPNPVYSNLTISFPENYTPSTIEIFDMKGANKTTIKIDQGSQNNFSIDTNKLTSGVYLIIIKSTDSNQIIRKKFIKTE